MKILHFSHNTLMTLATILLLFLFGVLVVYTVNLLQFPFDYDQGEGFELVDAVYFSQGQLPYRDIESYPFYSSNYPPLFHVITAPFVWIFGEAYWYGRLVGFLASVIAAIAIGYAVFRDGGKHRWIALLSGLAFLAANTVYHISPLFRQHMTMVMFETLAIVLLATAFPKQDNKKIALGLFLLICAGYTKQLAAITAIAVLFWMFLQNPRRAIVWGLGFAITGGLVFVLLYLLSDGQWWLHAIVANVNQFDRKQALDLFGLWFKLYGFLIVPAVLMMLYQLYFERISLYVIWFVFATLLGGFGSGTWGAGDSYFATSIAAICILSGIFASRTLQRSWAFPPNYLSNFFINPLRRYGRVMGNVGLVIIPLLYLLYGIAVFHMPTEGVGFRQIADLLNIQPNVRGDFYDSAGFDVVGYANIGYLTTQDDIDAGNAITEIIRTADASVMSEEAGFSLAAQADVVSNPTQLLNVWRAGLYDGTELLDMIANQEFANIIIRAQFYPQPILDAINDYYSIDQTIRMNHFDYAILAPKTAS